MITFQEIIGQYVKRILSREKMYSESGSVLSVNKESRTCSVEIETDDIRENVLLQADPSTESGLIIFPVVGSKVIISYLNPIHTFVSSFTEIEEMQFKTGETECNIGEDISIKKGDLEVNIDNKIEVKNGTRVLTIDNNLEIKNGTTIIKLESLIEFKNAQSSLKDLMLEIWNEMKSLTVVTSCPAGAGTGSINPANIVSIDTKKLNVSRLLK